MVFASKPTGQTEVPRHIARAKNIRDEISKVEVIVFSNLNDDEEDDSSSLLVPSLSGRSAKEGMFLVDETGHVRRSVTKKQKTIGIANAIEQFAKSHFASSDRLAITLERMANSMGASKAANEKDQENYKTVNDKLDTVLKLFSKNIDV